MKQDHRGERDNWGRGKRGAKGGKMWGEQGTERKAKFPSFITLPSISPVSPG